MLGTHAVNAYAQHQWSHGLLADAFCALCASAARDRDEQRELVVADSEDATPNPRAGPGLLCARLRASDDVGHGPLGLARVAAI